MRIARAWFCLLLLAAEAASGQNPDAPPPERTLVFVGDVMLSRGVGRRMKAENDFKFPFRLVQATLATADLTFANLECPVSDQGTEQGHLYSFRADPRAIEGLLFAGFDVVSVANNHMYDWGPEALLDTLRRLREAGIRPVGAGANDLEAHYPLLVDLGRLRLAFLAYVDIQPQKATSAPGRPGVAWLDADRALADIRFARPLADLVIVSPHWGVEYAAKPNPKQVALARRMIDSGADLVVGTHPHVIQPVEEYGGRWIAYSLGNFVFDQRKQGTRRGLMLKVKVDGKRIVEVNQISIVISADSQTSLEPPSEKGTPAAKPRVRARTRRNPAGPVGQRVEAAKQSSR